MGDATDQTVKDFEGIQKILAERKRRGLEPTGGLSERGL